MGGWDPSSNRSKTEKYWLCRNFESRVKGFLKNWMLIGRKKSQFKGKQTRSLKKEGNPGICYQVDEHYPT